MANNDNAPPVAPTKKAANKNDGNMIDNISNNISSLDISSNEKQRSREHSSNSITDNLKSNDTSLNVKDTNTASINHANLASSIDPNDEELPMFVKDLLEQMVGFTLFERASFNLKHSQKFFFIKSNPNLI